MSMEAAYTTGADVLADWRDSVLSGVPPTFYPVGSGELARIEIGPGLVDLFGGPPGAGKTAFTMQLAIDALRLTPALRLLVCNVEMPPPVLLDRQLARLSGIDLTTIRYRRLGAEHAERIDRAICTLDALADRLCFVRPPFTLANVAEAADAFEANVLLLDYIQRIPPPGQHDSKRGSIDATMDYLRRFADAGVAVLAVSAVSRTKDSMGRSSYAGDGLNLASFRESSELEYGADDAFMLVPDAEPDATTYPVELRHLKSRYGERRDIALTFDGRHQQFTPVAGENAASGGNGELTTDLRTLWDRTGVASHVGGDDG